VTILRRSLWRDVRARGGQFVAIVATIVLGVALFAASYDAFLNLTVSYQSLYDDLAFADLWAVGGDSGRVADDGAAVPGVAAADTRPVGEVPVRIGDHDQLARLVGLPDGREPDVNRVMILRGRDLAPGRVDEVLAEQHLGLQPGQVVQVLGADGWRTVTVVGVAASAEYLWPARSRQEVLVPQDQWGVLFAPASLVRALPPTTFHEEALFRLAPGAGDGTLERLREAALAAGAIATSTQAEQPSNAALHEDLEGFGEMSVAFPVMFLLAGALALAILLGRLVETQRAQIGVLAANGLGRREILLHYLGFGLVVGLAGAIPGAILGGLFAAVISRLYTAAIAVPVTVIEVRPTTIAVGLLIGVLAGALAAAAPALRASRTSPAEAMRGSGPTGRGGISVLERIVPPLRALPTRWHLVLRGPGRNRRRTLSTIIGVALAATLILVSAGMIDTVQVLLDRQFLEVQRQDASVQLTEPVAAASVGSLIAVPGVAAAEPVVTVTGAIVNGDERYATTIVGLEQATTMHGFRAPGGGTVDLPAEGLLLGSALRGRLGVDTGDTVTVEAIDGGPSATLPVAGFVDEPFGTYAYGSLATVAALAGQPPGDPAVSVVYVRYAAGADAAATAERLGNLPGVAAVIDSRALYAMAQSFMGLFYAFVGLALLFGAVMAFAVIFTTMSANVAERTTELAALRTLGMARSTVSWLVTSENVALTLLGLVPGLLVGYVGAALFMASFSSDLFQFSLEVHPRTFVVTALAILLVALASQWPALRRVGRIDLGRTVRERAT
jgi:putative ABC transport system permease protein